MKKSQSYILILSTIIMISLTISVSWFRDIESRRIEGERFLFPELGTPTDESSLKMLNNIVTLKIESIKGEFYINKSQEKWTLPSLANFPVSIDKIKRVIVGLSQLETIEPKTKNPELHSELGLNLPTEAGSTATSITLISNDDKILASLIVGKDSKSGRDTRYVRRPGENQTWLAWRNFDLADDAIGWLEDDLFSIARWRVADIKISHIDEPEVFISRANFSEQYFKVQNLKEDELPLNPYVGNQIGAAIEKLPIKNIIKKYTGNKNKLTETVFTTFDGLKIHVTNFEANDSNWVEFSAEFDSRLRRELPEDGPTIVGLPEMPTIEEVKNEVISLNQSFENWSFQFNESKHDLLTTNLKNITKKKEINQD